MTEPYWERKPYRTLLDTIGLLAHVVSAALAFPFFCLLLQQGAHPLFVLGIPIFMAAVNIHHVHLKYSNNRSGLRTCTCHGTHIYDRYTQNGYDKDTGEFLYHI